MFFFKCDICQTDVFFMSSLATLVTIVLYTACGVRHSLFRGKLSSYQQLHLYNSVLGFKIFLLWDEIAELILLMQLYLIFTMFLCKILCRIWMVGKCSFSNFENTAPTLGFYVFWMGWVKPYNLSFEFPCFVLFKLLSTISKATLF